MPFATIAAPNIADFCRGNSNCVNGVPIYGSGAVNTRDPLWATYGTGINTQDPLWATYGQYGNNWCLNNPACNRDDVFWAVRGNTPGAWSDWCLGNSNCDNINDWCIGNSNCWNGYQSYCADGRCDPGLYNQQYLNVYQNQINAQIQAMQRLIAQTTDPTQQQALQQQMSNYITAMQNNRFA